MPVECSALKPNCSLLKSSKIDLVTVLVVSEVFRTGLATNLHEEPLTTNFHPDSQLMYRMIRNYAQHCYYCKHSLRARNFRLMLLLL